MALRCSRCRLLKPEDEFGLDRSRPGRGRAYLCAPCRRDDYRARYVSKGHPGRRGWLVPTRDGDKRQARRRVNYLVEQGLIPRPDDLDCVDCADMVYFERYRHEYDHARGYDGLNQLYVEPVCRPCHWIREDERRHG